MKTRFLTVCVNREFTIIPKGTRVTTSVKGIVGITVIDKNVLRLEMTEEHYNLLMVDALRVMEKDPGPGFSLDYLPANLEAIIIREVAITDKKEKKDD